MFFDPLYFLILAPALIFSLWAQWKVKSTFAKYSRVSTFRGMRGADIARQILDHYGLTDVPVEMVQGFLSDHYDPIRRVLRLSPDVYNGTSVASIGVAAHETGHAIQHKFGYKPLALRTFMAPAASVGSNLSWWLLILGFIFSWSSLIYLGIGLFTLAVVFTLITLPVEFDASRRAKETLNSMGIVNVTEADGVAKVLNAAAMTYVAAAAVAVLQLIYLLLRANDR